MIRAVCSLKSTAPYCQSKFIDKLEHPMLEKELADAYEVRLWRERMHTTEDGFVFMPPSSFKNCIAEAALYLGRQIPGKGRQTFVKHFEAGILVTEPLILPIKAIDVKPIRLPLPVDGKRGSGKRVVKLMPCIPAWEGDVTFLILDPIITKDVFVETLVEAGKFIGIGTFRPRRNGWYGRFEVVGVKWIEA